MMNLPTIREPLIIGLVITLFVFLPIYGFLNLNEDQFVYEVQTFDVFEDGEFEILQYTQVTPSGVLDLGVANEAYVGFDIANFKTLSGDNSAVVVEVKNPTFREVVSYQKDESGMLVELNKSGTNWGKTDLFASPNPLIFLGDDTGVEKIYLSILSNEPIVFEVSVVSEDGFHAMYYKKALIVNVYIGIMFALFLYNFILYFLIKDRTYFYYCFYILFIALAQTSLMGYSYYYFLGMNVKLYEVSIIGFSAISGVAGISFMRLFLKTKYYTPILDKFLQLNIVVYLAAFVFRLLGSLSISYTLTDISGLMVILLFGFTATKIARIGYRPAAYFIIGWLFFFIGLLIFILQSNGFINVTMVANFPMLLGTAMEAILLSLALADKINVLKKEKEEEQMERLRMLKENEKLILDQNESLEAKVRARTEELENTLVNLQNTQTQLVNQEKMASLGQLTAGIAHEINNPINFVSSNISPLKRDIKDLLEVVQSYRDHGAAQFSEATKKELNELEEDIELDYVLQEIDQLLRGMEDGAKRTVEIVKGLRLFSRVDEQDVKKVDIHDGINSTLVLLNSSMSGKIKIIKEYGEIPMVECLAGKINQVFMNIITNAIHALQDHMPSNPDPEIKIITSNHYDYISIEIKDNGPGMPESVKQRIFEPFFTTKAVGKGTGLGLSIVYTIIENHGGTLEVETLEGQGTSFIITLPIYQNTIQNE
ncbi:sensor histidine kinase [Belliella sp. DSM 111904]|uniref:histidine kinase n=1 Tax=Belliella filtrata TaxID=2923435 RepID=A0ABS9V1M2_9BACT|nr:7TM diverse intracellular signaling domain-containing protein [Belliella filtrata]MCH7410315.1 sensor histidine kinase [Belliella filtrata]